MLLSRAVQKPLQGQVLNVKEGYMEQNFRAPYKNKMYTIY